MQLEGKSNPTTKGKTMTNITDTGTAAQLTKCEFPNRAGDGHDEYAPKSDWSHNLHADKFDDGLITAEVLVIGDAAFAEVYLEGFYTDAPAEELRAAADKYESFPASLRTLADQVDARNLK